MTKPDSRALNAPQQSEAASKPKRRGRPVGDHESKRAELLAAAIAVTAEEGYAGASLRKVAKRFGGTTGAVTYYFANKEEMITAVIEELFNRVDNLLNVDTENIDIKQLMQQFLTWPETSETDLWLVFIQLLAHAKHEPAFATVLAQRNANFLAKFASVIEKGQCQGVIRKDIPAAILADQLSAMCDGWMILMPFEPERFTPERIQTLLDAIAKLIAPPQMLAP
ncbi:TetR/AcrR family transcriptional regulator [Photobacterium sp. TY1-4]|uniref:TetR/AcrR family transcriptional regulator n=1 Tax=Photobacterium sp. TY1-4 TaxID=2899122 RepID=UPI0021BF66B9|nr:TetR/AcrR family transcriptional regulator [Photobacterium sp. TY1-4]UXH99986.1 TetR/AcrR family transcriptional regulator [Photobacterium sp. TY1-4]